VERRPVNQEATAVFTQSSNETIN